MYTAVFIVSAVSAFDKAGIMLDKDGDAVVAGLRDDAEQPGTRNSEGKLMINGDTLDSTVANYRGSHGAIDNHLDITKQVRDDCVTGKITNNNADGTTTVRDALVNGASCFNSTTRRRVQASDEATCVTKYEAKFRGDHRKGNGEPGVTGATGVGSLYADSYTMYGEVHLCQWVSLMQSCEAGRAVAVCPEASEDTPYVIEVHVASGGAGGTGDPGGPGNEDTPTPPPTPPPTPAGSQTVSFELEFDCSMTLAEVQVQVEIVREYIATSFGVPVDAVQITYTHSHCPTSFVQGATRSLTEYIEADVVITTTDAAAVSAEVERQRADGFTELKAQMKTKCEADPAVSSKVLAEDARGCDGVVQTDVTSTDAVVS